MSVWWGQNNTNSLKIVSKTVEFMKKSGMVSKCPEYYLVRHMNTHIQNPDHFSFNCPTS